MRRVLVATRSAGKLRELAPLLSEAGVHAIDLATAGIVEAPYEAAIESHETFEANALAKARYFAGRSGLPTLADDSGLCVDALGGRPGVRSKRWSGRLDLSGDALDAANNAMLASELSDLDAGRDARGAAYVCAMAYVDDEREVVRRGETRGEVLVEPRGAGGFGYDPYFWSVDLGRSFAEVTREEKARVSHRARALAAILRALTISGA
ncbi:MAG: non-canonical purine NTP pyrophosphatase [Gemmatimonadetes bacterium]|nr:non-canonical purine NTP pyrophosphatase [Gemmatimonadota bacterium]MCC6774866.1 non-canonical purine NTP pyrophosphatase [Gemmatimonadaceae bacterium]